jgi:hypothetical protein
VENVKIYAIYKMASGGKIHNFNVHIEDKQSTDVILDNIEQTQKIKDIQSRLLESLRQAYIPRLKGLRKELLGNRGWTFTMGIGRRRQHGIGEFNANKNEPDLFKIAIEYGNAILPTGFKYSTITVNRNLKANKHTDTGNSGIGCITFLGNYNGGGLYIYDTKDKPTLYDTHNTLILFNGANLAHKTESFDGERYALIYYNQQFTKSIKGVKMEGV